MNAAVALPVELGVVTCGSKAASDVCGYEGRGVVEGEGSGLSSVAHRTVRLRDSIRHLGLPLAQPCQCP